MRPIDGDALMEYALNQKEHKIGPNEIARFPAIPQKDRTIELIEELEKAKWMIRRLLLYSSPDNCPYCAHRDKCTHDFEECYRNAKWIHDGGNQE